MFFKKIERDIQHIVNLDQKQAADKIQRHILDNVVSV